MTTRSKVYEQADLNLIYAGTIAVNNWRRQNPNRVLNLQGSRITGVYLGGAKLSPVDLEEAKIERSYFAFADLSEANLDKAEIHDTNFTKTDLSRASLHNCTFKNVNLNRTILPNDCSSASFVECEIEFKGNGAGPFRLSYKSTKNRATRRSLQHSVVFRISFFIISIITVIPAMMTYYLYPIRTAFTHITWPLVRQFGSLTILTKASYISLLVVPFVAGLWPAVRGVFNRIAKSASDVSFDTLAAVAPELSNETLKNIASGATVETLTQFAGGARQETLDKIILYLPTEPVGHLPDTFAAAFFGALAVVLGHLVYEIAARTLIKNTSQNDYKSVKVAEFNPSADDHRKRLEDALSYIEKKIVAIEAGASSEFYMLSHSRTYWAIMALSFYGVGGAFIFFIVWKQVLMVIKAVGWL